MRRLTAHASVALLIGLMALGQEQKGDAQTRVSGKAQRIDLVKELAEGKLRAVNRRVTALEGSQDGVHVSAAEGPGVVWIDGIDFSEGTIEIDVRGRDVPQRSFVGVAFRGTNDKAYEVVYVRPFNFRSTDPARRQHAVQYIALPDYDWRRLRKEFPSEFENPVDASIVPTGWVPLKIVAMGEKVEVTVGSGTAPSLEARKLGQQSKGGIGLWVGNNSDGAFANLRLTSSR